MAKKVFNFKDQLRIGDVGEAHFIEAYKNLKPKKHEKNRKIDFTLSDGKTVELKTDSYDMEKTPNMFMEHETIMETKTILGGPWRALDHNIDYFVYYYLKNKIFFWFKSKDLVKCIEKYIKSKKLKPIAIQNRNSDDSEFKSYGYKIPRECLKKVLLKEDKI